MQAIGKPDTFLFITAAALNGAIPTVARMMIANGSGIYQCFKTFCNNSKIALTLSCLVDPKMHTHGVNVVFLQIPLAMKRHHVIGWTEL